jgi:transcriptional regulator GlxA family with amidase domain
MMVKDIRERVDQLDIHLMVEWVNELTDPVEQMVASTILIDRVRDQLMPELAAIRRNSTVRARQHLIQTGLRATDATRKLAELSGQSPQTVNRMFQERHSYGGDNVD